MLLIGRLLSSQPFFTTTPFQRYPPPSFHRRTISPLSLDEHYSNLKKQVINSERRILKELGFCVHVKHPHKVHTPSIIPSTIHLSSSTIHLSLSTIHLSSSTIHLSSSTIHLSSSTLHLSSSVIFSYIHHSILSIQFPHTIP